MEAFKPLIDQYYSRLAPESQAALDEAVDTIVKQKERGNKVMVITGSGPNLHEGVTTLISELMHKGMWMAFRPVRRDRHELAGSLDRVHRVHGPDLGFHHRHCPVVRFRNYSINRRRIG